MNDNFKDRVMLFRFSLYGFLKNQQYFEPFLILAFLEKGLSFFEIGLLIGFRELSIIILEIPTGAVADLYGRRRSMILSFVAYMFSFVVLAYASALGSLFAAMLLFACGEAFRTGTHKAMIFEWLSAKGREKDTVRVYGYTRSWSKAGSAVSVLIAASLVVFWKWSYSGIFLLCIVPYTANIVNFMGYPSLVDGAANDKSDKGSGVIAHIREALRQAWKNKLQRRLLIESAGFEGAFKAVKDYLQPTIKSAALGMAVLSAYQDRQRTAIVIGAVYFVLYSLSSVASRQSHRITKWKGGENRAARSMWFAVLVFYAALAALLMQEMYMQAIVVYVLLHIMQNIWRPVLIARLNDCSDPDKAATTLSIESQAKSLFAAIAAPILGLAVDTWGLWVVGLMGAAVAGIQLLAWQWKHEQKKGGHP